MFPREHVFGDTSRHTLDRLNIQILKLSEDQV